MDFFKFGNIYVKKMMIILVVLGVLRVKILDFVKDKIKEIFGS